MSQFFYDNPDDPSEPHQVEERTTPRTPQKKNRQKRFHENVPCEKCDKTFFNKDTLKKHTEDVHRNGLLKCNQCDYACKDGRSMKFHVQEFHEGKMLRCKLCDYEVSRKINLANHIRRKHAGLEYEYDTGKRIVEAFACTKCDHKAYTKERLTHHVKVKHEGFRYKCSKCNSNYSNKTTLKVHIREIHENMKKYKKNGIFQCEHCPEMFWTNSAAHSHIHFAHLKHGDQCQQCGKTIVSDPSRATRDNRSGYKKLEIKAQDVNKEEDQKPLVKTEDNHMINDDGIGVLDADEAADKTEDAEKEEEKMDIIKTEDINLTTADPIKAFNKEISEQTEDDSIKYPCHICDNEFSEQTSLRTHIILHLRISKGGRGLNI